MKIAKISLLSLIMISSINLNSNVEKVKVPRTKPFVLGMLVGSGALYIWQNPAQAKEDIKHLSKETASMIKELYSKIDRRF